MGFIRMTISRRDTLAWLASLLGVLGLQGPAIATPLYTVTDVGTLPGDTNSYAYGINNSGQVLGGNLIYSNGQLTPLNLLGGEHAWGINDLGQVRAIARF